jgi:hypothetical protein
MSNNYKKLDEVFNVDSTEIVSSEVVDNGNNKPVKNDQITSEIKKDYEYTRGNLYSIIEKGQEALDNALEIAVDGGQPRSYEVVAQLIKSVSDTTDKLLDLQKKLKDLDNDSPKSPSSITNNAVFLGSTAELAKFLKSNKEQLGDK